MIFQLPNPIPNEVHDPKDLQEWILENRVIPYYGTDEITSHNFLKLLQTVTQLSPTFGAVLFDLKQYIFGLNPVITARNIPGLGTDVPEVEFGLASEFVGWLKALGLDLRTISKLSRRIKHHLAQCGNAYLLIKRIREGSAVRYLFKAEHFLNCIYIESDDAGEEFLLVSPYLDRLDKMYEYPPRLVRVTPYGEPLRFAERADGVEETIVHLKVNANEDEGERYGRPEIFGCLPWLYVDHQIGNLNSKVSAAELISKMLLAMEGPDPDVLPDTEFDGSETEQFDELGLNGKIGTRRRPQTLFQQNMFRLKELVSNLAVHPSKSTGPAAAAIAGIEYPHGGKPPVAIPLEVNRDTKHQTWQLDSACSIICGKLGWSPILIAFQQAKTNLGGNLLYDTFAMKNVTTVVPEQVFHADLWNDIIAQIMEAEGAPANYRGLGIEFPDVIGELVEQLRPAATPGNVTNLSAETDPANNLNLEDDA